MTGCRDCDRSTSGSCWRHPVTITVPPIPESSAEADAALRPAVLAYLDHMEKREPYANIEADIKQAGSGGPDFTMDRHFDGDGCFAEMERAALSRPATPPLDVVLAALTNEDEIAHGEAYTPERGGLGECAYDDEPWPCRTQRGIDRLLAALANLATPPLDVERLAEALVMVEENHLNGDCMSDTCNHPDGECPEYSIGCGDAAEIAREYAALANPDPETAS